MYGQQASLGINTGNGMTYVDRTSEAVVVTVPPTEDTPKEVLVKHNSADSVLHSSGSGSYVGRRSGPMVRVGQSGIVPLTLI